MPLPRLHRDAEASLKAMYTALVARGHDLTRSPNIWMLRGAPDTLQLLGATAQGRVIVTFGAHRERHAGSE
jgi:hypothetical protein